MDLIIKIKIYNNSNEIINQVEEDKIKKIKKSEKELKEIRR